MAANSKETELHAEDEETKKVAEDIIIVQDDGFFAHSTGDTYDGGFEIRRKERTVRMNGNGTYKTNEGDVYTGLWDYERLVGEIRINFVDGSEYVGPVKDMCYHGHGQYTYPDKCVLTCDFEWNFPIGNLTLTDPNHHTWLAKAETGYAWFYSVNHYYSMLERSKMERIEQVKQIVSQKASKESSGKRKSQFSPSSIRSKAK